MASQEHRNELVVEQVLAALKAEQHGDNRWRGLCPAHDDHNPSLDIYVNADGYVGFSCLSKKCKHFEIAKAIKAKFGIEVPARRSANHQDKTQSARVMYPAHEAMFPFHLRKEDDVIYEYTVATGEPAFYVQRYMDSNRKQTPAWFSWEYVSDGGQVSREWSCKSPPRKDRPLYNLHLLTQDKTKPVLVVEGEKTADAASEYKQLEGFIVTTWSGGAQQVGASDWQVLRDRATPVYFWPDHDAEGAKAMRQAAAFVTTGPEDQRLNMLTFAGLMEERIDKGWDLADGCANESCDYAFEQLWDTFKPHYVEDKVSSATLEEALARFDKRYRKLRIGGAVYILDMQCESDQSPFGVEWLRDPSAMSNFDTEKVIVEAGDKIKVVSVAKEWCDSRGDGPLMMHGTTFDPTRTDREVQLPNGKKCLNTFPGFRGFTADRHDGLVKLWLEHLEGMVDELPARDWIVDYFADIFQNPANKPGTALALLGGQGVGKSVLVQCVSTLLGSKLTRIVNKDIMRNNIALSRSLLVIHDEWSINHYKEKLYYETLKNAITNTRLKIEEKYLPAWESDSFCRFAFTSNDARPIRLPPDDRRFTIVHCGKRWHGNKEHFNGLFAALGDDSALGGFLNFFKDRKIKSELRLSFNTRQKDELWEPDNKVLAELIQWADGNGLPVHLQEVLGQAANNFGEEPVTIPRSVMRDYVTKAFGNSAYGGSDVAILKRVMPGPEFKRRVSTFDRRGGESRTFDLCFEVPRLQQFRRNIEKELGRNYPWNDAEIRIDPEATNVVPLKRESPL